MDSNKILSPEDIHDFRSAIEFLKQIPGQYIETDEEVDPVGELSGVYRYIGAAGTTKRPTKIGPMMMFNNIKGHPGARVATGIVACRNRVAQMMGYAPQELGHKLTEALSAPVPPVTIPREKAQCQEVVHMATDPGFDIRKLVPAPTNTLQDAGPYITMGLVYAEDPETGKSDVTIHRQCLQAPDEISIYFAPGRHIDSFRENAEKAGKALPITINIGLDPAVYIAACFEPPATPIGFNELEVAGAFRKRPVELVDCLTVNSKAIANAEIVIEGEILPDVRMREDEHSNTGFAMPEFPGFTGEANPAVKIMKVKSVTTRTNPICQTTIGCSEEHVNLAGIPTEASILSIVNDAMPGKVKNVYAHSSGGGKLLAVMQMSKKIPTDQGRERQAALCAFAAFPELKTVILVDDDVDIFDSNDVLWAMMTRYQSDVDTIIIPGVRSHPLDPSQSLGMSPSIIAHGTTCKTIFDCTAPFHMKDKFIRSDFMEVDYKRFLPKEPTC